MELYSLCTGPQTTEVVIYNVDHAVVGSVLFRADIQQVANTAFTLHNVSIELDAPLACTSLLTSFTMPSALPATTPLSAPGPTYYVAKEARGSPNSTTINELMTSAVKVQVLGAGAAVVGTVHLPVFQFYS